MTGIFFSCLGKKVPMQGEERTLPTSERILEMTTSFIARTASACLGLFLLAACSANPTGSDSSASAKGKDAKGAAAEQYGAVKFSLDVGKVGALSKAASTAGLKKLILTAVSGGEKPDTVRDTSSLSGYDQQHVKRTLKLKPKSAWVLYAKTLDHKDSVVHQGTAPSFAVKIADTANVTLVLQSRFTRYQATFKDLPISIGPGDGNGDKVGVAITRLVMKVDGVVKCDSTAASYFGNDQTVALKFDYVTIGKHDFTLEAYGQVLGKVGLLYTGAVSITTVPGEDGARPVTMTWVGPSDGGMHGNIIVGKVGSIELKPNFPDKI
jgi:hypothetical protein